MNTPPRPQPRLMAHSAVYMLRGLAKEMARRGDWLMAARWIDVALSLSGIYGLHLDRVTAEWKYVTRACDTYLDEHINIEWNNRRK